MGMGGASYSLRAAGNYSNGSWWFCFSSPNQRRWNLFFQSNTTWESQKLDLFLKKKLSKADKDMELGDFLDFSSDCKYDEWFFSGRPVMEADRSNDGDDAEFDADFQVHLLWCTSCFLCWHNLVCVIFKLFGLISFVRSLRRRISSSLCVSFIFIVS